MARLIDADNIRLKTETYTDENGEVLVTLRDVRRAIAQTPTEDAVCVVRCKDCAYSREDAEIVDLYHCSLSRQMHKGSDYCNYSTRKEKV